MRLDAAQSATKECLIDCITALAGKSVIIVRLFRIALKRELVPVQLMEKDDVTTAEMKPTAFHSFFHPLSSHSFIKFH